MGRHKKAGLDYFPLDTNFFEDKRIRRLISRFGPDGPMFYLYILSKAYGNSYFVKYDDDFADDAALDLNCSVEKIGLMLHYLLDKSLLDSTLFNTVKVLSSHGIQIQYQEIKKDLKRDIEVDGDSWILDESETEGFIKVRLSKNKSGINGDKSGINDGKSAKKALKESKENESKVNKSSEWGFGDDLTEAFSDWLSYKQEKRQAYKPTGLRSLITQVRNQAYKHGETAVAKLIRECMASNWQGIIWDKLEKPSGQKPAKGPLTSIGKEDPEKAREDMDRMKKYLQKLRGDTGYD